MQARATLPIRRATNWLAIIVLGAISLAHLAITWLYNGPDNFIKITLDRTLSVYFGNVLFQNWSFFAPLPIDRDTFLLARARYRDGTTTKWVNITAPIESSMEHNRLSSYEFIATSLMNASLDARNMFVKMRKTNSPTPMMDVPQFRPLYRTAASVLSHLYGRGVFSSVQIALQQSEYPRFTHRTESGDRAVRLLYLFDWQAFPNVDSRGWLK